jgi:lipopolysaccharide export system protein LptA
MKSLRVVLVGLLSVALRLSAANSMSPAGTDITSDQVDSSTTGDVTTSVFTGHVVVVGNNTRITCDYLKAVSVSKAGETTASEPQQFRYLLATGHVRILESDRDTTCERAEVLPAQDQLTLSGNPVVTLHSSGEVYTGDPLIVQGHNGKYTVSGHNVRIRSASALKDLALPKNPPPKS